MRQYKMTATGEQPIWATKKELIRMGEEQARRDFNHPWSRTKSPRYGNLTYDAAYEAEWTRLEKENKRK